MSDAVDVPVGDALAVVWLRLPLLLLRPVRMTDRHVNAGAALTCVRRKA